MKILVYVGHPAQYLFFRKSIYDLQEKSNKIILLLKTKDILEDLVNHDGFKYINIIPKERGTSKFSIGINLIKRLFRILPIILSEKPDLLIGGDPSISQLGWLLRKKRITLTEDDYPVIKKLADITFPFAQVIVAPEVCDVKKWDHNKIGYNGYMKLAYLHPNVFTPNKAQLKVYKIDGNFALIRLAKLTAHHDFGIKGISTEILLKLIFKLESRGLRVLISSESQLAKEFQKYSLKINYSDVHHVLANASIFISDSQSMSVEAAMLGVPSIRYSDFAGRISVLEELEHKYSLTFGFPVGEDKLLFEKLEELLATENLYEIFQNRRSVMLNEKINVSAFITWFIENYPNSKKIMKENPDYQYNFR
jgi:hypothetical protein